MSTSWRLGLDPGKSTGWALFYGSELHRSGSVVGGFDAFTDWWGWENFSYQAGNIEIVCERYVPLEGFRGIDQTYSLEIQGAVRALAGQHNIPVKLQPRSDKAALFGQDELGDAGARERREWLAERGLTFETDHAMDAATHVLVERRRARDIGFYRRYWGSRG